jgi:type VI secretion system protein ImpF
MKGFPQTLFDKLIGEHSSQTTNGNVTRLSMEQVKDSVARDLEALLNTRAVIAEDTLEDYPECGRSILSYGLCDFAGLSLAIARHEPRLRNVRATLEVDQNSINKLYFGITAMLVVNESKEPVSFDALLQPSSLQYSINSSKRTSAVRLGV